jgi:hypothetical protein
MTISRSILPIMRNILVKVVEKIKTHILCSMTVSNGAVYGIMWKNMIQPFRPHDSIIRNTLIGCWRTKATDTLRKCHTFCFSTVRMVTRKRLSVKFYVHFSLVISLKNLLRYEWCRAVWTLTDLTPALVDCHSPLIPNTKRSATY